MTTRVSDLDLDHASLAKDLASAERALGVTLELGERKDAEPNGRVSVSRTFRIALPIDAPELKARFVKQGLAQRAKKLFVHEIEVGEPTFDDAVYIATDTTDETTKLVGHDRARAALVALVNKGCVIDIIPGELLVVQTDAEGPSDDEAAEVVALAACLLSRAP